MNGTRAIRLANSALRRSPAAAATTTAAHRCITTTASPSLMSSFTTQSGPSPAASSSSTAGSVATLSNIEAKWELMSDDDKFSMQEQLDEMQKQDWKALSVEEKKAAYFVAFGPHGPRAPISKPGDNFKILAIVLALCGVAGIMRSATAKLAPPPPKTMTPEWQEASNERARQQKMNPFSGISSEGYSGKGFVTTK